MEKIPIRILPEIQEISKKAGGLLHKLGTDLENHPYYFSANNAKEFKRYILDSENLYDNFHYDFSMKTEQKKFKNPIMSNIKSNLPALLQQKHNIINFSPSFQYQKNNQADKLNVNIIVGHNNIFKEKLSHLVNIYKSPPENLNRNQELNDTNLVEKISYGYKEWYNEIFKVRLLNIAFEKLSKYRTNTSNSKRKENNVSLHKDNNLKQIFKNRFLFDKIINYILFKNTQGIPRKILYERHHENIKTDLDFFKPFVQRYSNTSYDENIEKIQHKLDIANGTVILFYKKNNKLFVQLLFHGFPDKFHIFENNNKKYDGFLDYNDKIELSKNGNAFFDKLLQENQGVIFVRHEFGFHNGKKYSSIGVLDSPLTAFGIYKSIMINRFLNQKLFSLSDNPSQKSSLFDLINIKQMIVSPLIRTHMTGILIFNNSYINYLLSNSNYSGGRLFSFTKKKNKTTKMPSKNNRRNNVYNQNRTTRRNRNSRNEMNMNMNQTNIKNSPIMNLKASHTEIVFFQLLDNLTNNYVLFNNNGEGNNKYFEFTPSKLIQNSLNTNQLNFNQKVYKFLNINKNVSRKLKNMNKNLNKRHKNVTRKNKNFSRNFKKYFKSYVKKHKDQLPEFIQNLTDKQITIIGNNKHKFEDFLDNEYKNSNNDVIINFIIDILKTIEYKYPHDIDTIISRLDNYSSESLFLFYYFDDINVDTGTHYNQYLG